MMLNHILNIHPPTAGRFYLDPGTGSLLLQLLAAAVMGALFVVATSWRRVKRFLRRIFKRSGTQQDEPSEDEQIGEED